MKTVKSNNDVKANRNLLNKINTNISTLKCYNFDLEGDDIESSSFLIEMEEKIHHLEYTKWEEEKIKIKAEGEEVRIEGFVRLCTSLINIEEKAQYVRKQGRPNDINKPVVRNINSYYASMKPQSHEQKRTNYGNQQNKGNDSKVKPRNQYQPSRKIVQS